MKKSKRICVSLLVILLIAIISGCTNITGLTQEKTELNHSYYITYRDISNLSEVEIKTIEAFKEENRSFTIGLTESTEAFYDYYGNAGGYGVLLCDLLTSFFGIDFVPQIYQWDGMIHRLEAYEIDFLGNITDSERHREAYIMSNPLVRRSMKIVRLHDSQSLDNIQLSRTPRYLFYETGAAYNNVSSVAAPDTYEAVFAPCFNTAYQMLVDGEADVFIGGSVAEAAFGELGSIILEDFFPQIFSQISIATANPDLEPIISILNKTLQNENMLDYMQNLYKIGDFNYKKHLFYLQLNEDEKNYLKNTTFVPYVAPYRAYPASFYNEHEGKMEGSAIDVLHEIEKLTGLTFELINNQNTPVPELLEMLYDGKANLMAFFIITNESDDRFIWLDKMSLPDNYALISKRSFPDIDLSDIPYARIGLPLGTPYAEAFWRWFPGALNVSKYVSIDDAFDALERGEVDLVMAGKNRVAALSNYYELSGYKVNYLFNGYDGTIGFNKDQIILYSIMDKALLFIDSNKIVEKWMTVTYDYQAKMLQSQRPLLIGATAMSLIILLLILILFYRNRNEGKRLIEQVAERTEDIANREKLLDTGNQTANVLLATISEENFEETLLNGMSKIGIALDADRVQIWRNEMINGALNFVMRYEWLSETGKQKTEVPYGLSVPYSHKPEWEALFRRREYINSPLSALPLEDQEFLNTYEMKSIVNIPLFVGDHFFGFISIDDCKNERRFTESEIRILHSFGLMLANALKQSDMMKGTRSANEAKSRFIANMSHEMRTPLNVVVGLTDLMLDEENLANDVKGNLLKINTAGNTLMRLISDVLDISKIESGKFELLPEKYELGSFINDVINLNVIRIEEKPIAFKLDIDENLPACLYGDDLRIREIINNLLSNAFKYTNKGIVTLGMKCEYKEDNEVWLSAYISDTGIGIREKDIHKLFTDYNQVDTRANRKIEGTGLGLSITKMLVELMGGEITVESEYGKGTIFRFYIKQGFVSDRKIGMDVANNLRSFNYDKNMKRTKREKLVRIDLSYAKVLVVDDFPTNLDVAAGMLRKYKMHVDCVESGQEAIELIKNGEPRYNAVFMDHMMPEMDGIEATKNIRALETEYAQHIPIIALTANAVAGTEQIFLENGFQTYLSKPINIMNLDAVVKQWVSDGSHE